MGALWGAKGSKEIGGYYIMQIIQDNAVVGGGSIVIGG
jgi:hypothetical protein